MRRQINSEELQTLYALIGEGIWQLQNVEDALHNYITIKKDVKVPGAVSSTQAQKTLENNRKNTLGVSLNIARKSNVLSPTLQSRLESFKDERNWLVHGTVHQHREDCYIDDKRTALLKRIKAFSDEAGILQKLIVEEFMGYAVSHGKSKEKIFKEAEKQIRKFKGEVS